MKMYKGISYKVVDVNFIQFHNSAEVTQSRGPDGTLKTDNNGSRLRSIPERFLDNPDVFAKLAIDTAIYNYNLNELEVAREDKFKRQGV